MAAKAFNHTVGSKTVGDDRNIHYPVNFKFLGEEMSRLTTVVGGNSC